MIMDAVSSKFPSLFSFCTPKPQPSPPIHLNPKTISISKTRSKRQPEEDPSTRNIRSTSLAVTILNAFDHIINTFIDPPVRRPSVDPHMILVDNFAPVHEFPPTECEVIYGSLPDCLINGTYIRNGPNPQFFPRGPYHHFDGDGMLHAIRISTGRVTLCSRYVQTYKFSVEKKLGGPVIPNFFSDFNGLAASVARGALAFGRVLAGQFNPMNGIGPANTSLAIISGQLYALCESDLPYAVNISPDGDVVTVGRHDFGGKLLMSMTAHPKMDPETKEAFAFRYSLSRPILTYFRFDREGNKQPDVPIFSVTRPSLFHDFGVTKNYAVFVDIQIGFTPLEVVFRSGSSVGADPRKVSRVGIIPRYATDGSAMRWFELPGLNSLHVVNAWEEKGADVVMVVPNIMSVEHVPGRMDLLYIRMEKVMIDTRNGMVRMQPLATRNLDFAVINPNYTSKKNRYVYASIGDPWPKISGLVKLDLSLSETDEGTDCIVATRMFGPGCYGGEPFFVAKEVNNPMANEDDGYLICYVHNENTSESRFLVIDAQSPSLDIVAIVRLTHRVPYGFHGLFVRQDDININ